MDYATVKMVHQTAVTLSLAGFVARGAGMLVGAAWLERRIARTLPHVIDTLLLISGVTLAWLIRLSPLAAPWLAAKLIGLLVYIALGAVALRGSTPRLRAGAFVAALLTFAYIVSVAITKNPLGLLAALSIG